MIDISGAVKAIRKFEREIERAENYALVQAARAVQDDIIASNDFKGSKLRHSFFYKKHGKHGIRISSKKKHGWFLEYGTRPHVIRARRKKFLKFTASDGATVFRKQVFHPGNKPLGFFKKATDRGYETLARTFIRAMTSASNNFSK